MDRDKIFRQVMRTGSVQAACRGRARRIAAAANQISRRHGGKARYTVESHIRPKGRFAANVVSDSPAEEFGTDKTPRIGALRRAARSA